MCDMGNFPHISRPVRVLVPMGSDGQEDILAGIITANYLDPVVSCDVTCFLPGGGVEHFSKLQHQSVSPAPCWYGLDQ